MTDLIVMSRGELYLLMSAVGIVTMMAAAVIWAAREAWRNHHTREEWSE
jgi:hypothetical protein